MILHRNFCFPFAITNLLLWALSGISTVRAAQIAPGGEPIPEKLVVLTFDDSARSHLETVRPILLKYGFGATFFITEGFDFKDNKKDYMTWDEIAQLHRDGFEIGNHTRDHLAITDQNVAALTEQLQAIRDRCVEYNIPAPVSFAWPGNALSTQALDVLKEQGILFARRGGSPEYTYEKGQGFAYEPGFDHPLLIPSAGDARPNWELEDFVQAAQQARNGKIAVLQFHGVPDTAHSWVSFPTSLFELSMRYLAREGYQVIAMRDLSRFVDPSITPSDPNGIIEDRKSQLASQQILDNARMPRDDTELRFWLENMLVHHQFTTPEMTAATGMTSQEIQAAITRLGITKDTQSLFSSNKEKSALVTLPYPGGRHPRTGFRDGMLRPQRETKLSIFAPWGNGGYVVADFPEAIWWNVDQARELLYLAHTHVPTRWDRQGITLDRMEWEPIHKEDDGGVNRGWVSTRTLPNGVTFGVRATPHQDHVEFEMWIQNSTDKPMTGVSVQQCVMLARLTGFEERTNANKVIREPFVACKSSTGDRWVITAWESCQRGWANPPCPCIHSDPAFPDIPPGETRSLSGWVSFYEGTEIDAELERIQSLRQ